MYLSVLRGRNISNLAPVSKANILNKYTDNSQVYVRERDCIGNQSFEEIGVCIFKPLCKFRFCNWIFEEYFVASYLKRSILNNIHSTGTNKIFGGSIFSEGLSSTLKSNILYNSTFIHPIELLNLMFKPKTFESFVKYLIDQSSLFSINFALDLIKTRLETLEEQDLTLFNLCKSHKNNQLKQFFPIMITHPSILLKKHFFLQSAHLLGHENLRKYLTLLFTKVFIAYIYIYL